MAKTASKKTDSTSGGRPRLMLMDGHSLAYRAFFALPAENFTTATGQPTNAIYGFASMLANTLRDEAPTHFAVAFDVSRKTWRSEEFTEYKANRSKTPDEFKGQVELIGELLDSMHVPRFAVEGFEADDVIATLATQAEAERREAAERMALNAPIQGTAADIVKIAMLNVDRALREAGLESRMLLQVHDEIVLEIAPGERAAAEELVRREMANAVRLRVPLGVSVGVGPDWESAAH
ncbi:Flap endonuclease Xni [Streptomyces violaceorubidus]